MNRVFKRQAAQTEIKVVKNIEANEAATFQQNLQVVASNSSQTDLALIAKVMSNPIYKAAAINAIKKNLG